MNGPRIVPMKPVTQEEYHAYIAGFPERISSRTGICEPPIEMCIDGGVMIGRIVLNDPDPREYFIRDDHEG